MTTEQKPYVVYSMAIALELESLGIQPIGIGRNHEQLNFVVFMYENTPEFVKTLSKLIETKKKLTEEHKQL